MLTDMSFLHGAVLERSDEMAREQGRRFRLQEPDIRALQIRIATKLEDAIAEYLIDMRISGATRDALREMALDPDSDAGGGG